ncbi:hypothetical protein QCA50_009031 [Cerrena zonata]|uniref:DUF1753-domain-containing protein n=1 Tax=Cerrena zonata TaxID=2478898 RepID=A0AAW0G8E1_9APHY
MSGMVELGGGKGMDAAPAGVHHQRQIQTLVLTRLAPFRQRSRHSLENLYSLSFSTLFYAMKLTLRPEWRLRPLSSFLGFLDLKTGVTCALLFALLNKVAGVYGLIAVLTGAGGSAAQLSLYFYSVLGLIALAWGLRATTQEDPRHTLYFAHVFFADHVISTAWLVFFAVVWWIYTPHDGRNQANSPAQQEMAKTAIGVPHNMTEEERSLAAMTLWNHEKSTATIVIVLGWVSKFYFAALLYSYAIHLRKGSYRSLSTTRQPLPTHYQPVASSALPDEADIEAEDYYRLPATPLSSTTPNQSHSRSGSYSNPHNVRTHIRSGSAGGSSVGSFADFVSAPGRGSRRPAVTGRKSNLNPASGKSANGDADLDEVLFDEDEAASNLASTMSASRSASGGSGSDEERGVGGSSHGRRQSRTRL